MKASLTPSCSEVVTLLLSYMAVQTVVAVLGQPYGQEPLPMQECWL